MAQHEDSVQPLDTGGNSLVLAQDQSHDKTSSPFRKVRTVAESSCQTKCLLCLKTLKCPISHKSCILINI